MDDEITRRLMIELKRALTTALKAIDEYLAATTRTPTAHGR